MKHNIYRFWLWKMDHTPPYRKGEEGEYLAPLIYYADRETRTLHPVIHLAAKDYHRTPLNGDIVGAFWYDDEGHVHAQITAQAMAFWKENWL